MSASADVSFWLHPETSTALKPVMTCSKLDVRAVRWVSAVRRRHAMSAGIGKDFIRRPGGRKSRAKSPEKHESETHVKSTFLGTEEKIWLNCLSRMACSGVQSKSTGQMHSSTSVTFPLFGSRSGNWAPCPL